MARYTPASAAGIMPDSWCVVRKGVHPLPTSRRSESRIPRPRHNGRLPGDADWVRHDDSRNRDQRRFRRRWQLTLEVIDQLVPVPGIAPGQLHEHGLNGFVVVVVDFHAYPAGGDHQSVG